MFLKKAFTKSSINFKGLEIIKNSLKLNKQGLKPITEFKKFDAPPEHQRKIQRTILNFEMEKKILSTICNVSTEMQENRAHLNNIFEENKQSKIKFVLNVNHLHESNLEQILNYYLFNHEHFNKEELDYFLYLFCAKSELTNKITIKIKDLEQHKSINLIWDYFLKNYKKIDNIDDCNKFLYLFYIYFNKYSFNRDDFMGKFFNKNNNKFFLNIVEKYMKLSLDKIQIGKLLNMVTILGEFKPLNYYDYLKNREDEVEKLPYWTLRRLLVRVNSNKKKNEKSLRQLINLLINPLTKDFTSVDYNEKSYLLKHLCVLDRRIVLLSSSKKLKTILYEDLVKYVEDMQEKPDLDLFNLKILVNICQAAKYNEKLLDDGKVLKCLKKYMEAYDRLQIKPKSKTSINENSIYQENSNFSSSIKTNFDNRDKTNNESFKEAEAKSSELNNKDKLNDKEFNQDYLNKINKVNILSSNSINEDIDVKLKSGSSGVEIKEDLFFEEIEELNDFDLKLRVIRKKEEEELEFLESEAFLNPMCQIKTDNLEFEIFKKNSELEKFFFNEEKENILNNKNETNISYNNNNNKEINNQAEEKQNEIFSPKTSEEESFNPEETNNFNFDINDKNNLFFNESSNYEFNLDSNISSTVNSNSTTAVYSNSETKFNPSDLLQTKVKAPTDVYTRNTFENYKSVLSMDANDIIGYYFLLMFHNVILYKHHLFQGNKEFAAFMLRMIKKTLFNMDIIVLKEKIKVNLVFDAFVIMDDYAIADKELFNFLVENFADNMVDIIVMKPFISFIHWTEKHLPLDEKKAFLNRLTKILLQKLTKDYTIYNFFRITSLVCSINRERTNLTDNLHFELISFIDIECYLGSLLKLFSDYQKSLLQEVHKDYSRNLICFLLGKIKIKDLNLINNPRALMDFYFAMLAMDLEILDPELDKKMLQHYNNILKYIENSPLFEVELNNVVKYVYDVLEKYKGDNSERAVGLFLTKIEDIIKNKSILILSDIDRYMIYFALTLMHKERSRTLIEKAVRICDLVFEKTKRHLDLNLTESITAIEKLLEQNIICKSVVKNFLVNIQIFKRLKESENFKLDDQSNFDINLINYKYQNVERSKDIINELLEQLKDLNIISEQLFNISLLK